MIPKIFAAVSNGTMLGQCLGQSLKVKELKKEISLKKNDHNVLNIKINE